MAYTVGCVPYVNAKPLTAGFEELGISAVYEVPSKLPELLDQRRADAVLASSFEALRTPGRTFAEGVSIATLGEAQSVRLFSKVPFAEIQSLALDESSLTSNALAMVLLRERHGIDPILETCAPDLPAMLQSHDAAVLIGDPGMTADANGLHALDLGAAWRQMTGLPFVWALWIGRQDMPVELVGLLQRSAVIGIERIEHVSRDAAASAGWPLDRCRAYLAEVMDYRLTEEHLAGLREFHRLLLAHELVDADAFPRQIGAERVLAEPA